LLNPTSTTWLPAQPTPQKPQPPKNVKRNKT
jgi:hypothetical protein